MSAVSAIIAHCGNVGTGAAPTVSWKVMLVAHAVAFGSVTVTVIVAVPERPSAPLTDSVRAPPAPVVITIADCGTSVELELLALTLSALLMDAPLIVKFTVAVPLTGMLT